MRRFDNFRRSRNEQDKLLAKICIYAFILLAALILFEKVIGNLPNIGSSIAKATNYLNTLTAPFLMGFAIAYVMNPFLNFFEKIFKKSGAFFSEPCENHPYSFYFNQLRHHHRRYGLDRDLSCA